MWRTPASSDAEIAGNSAASASDSNVSRVALLSSSFSNGAAGKTACRQVPRARNAAAPRTGQCVTLASRSSPQARATRITQSFDAALVVGAATPGVSDESTSPAALCTSPSSLTSRPPLLPGDPTRLWAACKVSARAKSRWANTEWVATSFPKHVTSAMSAWEEGGISTTWTKPARGSRCFQRFCRPRAPLPPATETYRSKGMGMAASNGRQAKLSSPVSTWQCTANRSRPSGDWGASASHRGLG